MQARCFAHSGTAPRPITATLRLIRVFEHRIHHTTESALQIGDIVLITDLSSNSGRTNPLPALGRIEKFLDPESRSQAVVKYHSGRVDRPISRLVRVVKADEEISKKGKTICPYALADEDIQAGWNEDSEDIPAQNEYDMDRNHQDDDQHEDLQGAPQPHVQEEDGEQEVCRRPQGVQPPHLPRSQEMAQEEDGDEEKQETQEDFLTVVEGLFSMGLSCLVFIINNHVSSLLAVIIIKYSLYVACSGM